MVYEVERIFLTDEEGNPVDLIAELHTIEAASANQAAVLFVERDGARLLGTVCDAPGDTCTATAWLSGRAYVITVWPLHLRPHPSLHPGLRRP